MMGAMSWLLFIANPLEEQSLSRSRRDAMEFLAEGKLRSIVASISLRPS